jgi:hypothetical protein
MHISSAKKLIKNCIEKEVTVSFLFIGTMGIGKSQMMKQVADELEIGLIDLRLAQLEPGDIIGVPRSDDITNRTVWRKPEWWPEPGTRGILHLDELNRAPVDVRQAVFQLVLDKKMHTHELPKGWFVHSSINPDNGAYQVEQLDQAMLRRFCNIKITADAIEWVEYWHNRYGGDKHAELMAKFILANKNLLSLEEDFEITVKPTPDGYRMIYELLSSGAISSDIEAEVIRGLIGSEASIAFLKFMDKNYTKPIGGKEIIDSYDKVKKQVLSQENDAMYVTIHDLVAVLKTEKNISKKQMDNLAAFLVDANEETKSAVIVKIPDRMIEKLSAYPPLVSSVRQFMSQMVR